MAANTLSPGIKIDLLPASVRLGKWLKRVLAICLALLAATAGMLFYINTKQQERLEVVQANRDAVESVAVAAEAAKKAADDVTAATGPNKAAVDFFVAAGKTGPQRAALVDNITGFIYRNAVIDQLDISDGQTVRIRATMRNPNEYATFLENLRLASDTQNGILFAGLVNGSGIQTYNNGVPQTTTSDAAPQAGANPEGGAPPPPEGAPAQPVTPGGVPQPARYIFPINVNAEAKLKNPVAVPAEPGGGAPAPVDPNAIEGAPPA